MAEPADASTGDPRIDRRAEALLPEEEAAGTDDATAQARAVLEDSDARGGSRAAPDGLVEGRTSEEATPPVP